LLSAGRELVLSSQSAEAVEPLRAAAADSAVASEAQKLLLRIYSESNDTASLLRLADTLRGPTAPLGAVNDALITALKNGDPSLHARNLILIGSPEWAWRDRLTAATRGTTIADAAEALVDAYRRRSDDILYRPLAGMAWWMASGSAGRGSWSSAMRATGDWYYQTGALTTARGFYEAAIGMPIRPLQLGERWVDLEALPPLASIYGNLSTSTSTPDELTHIDRFVQALFGGKGEALAANDLRRIRLFRLTLGTLFARKERWDQGWNGAIYQLEDTRRLTAELRRKDPAHVPHNPPEPFETLAREYGHRGCAAAARSVAGEAVVEYRRRGLVEEASRVDAFTKSLSADSKPAKADSCAGPPFY
jgi:hypothetical protein